MSVAAGRAILLAFFLAVPADLVRADAKPPVCPGNAKPAVATEEEARRVAFGVLGSGYATEDNVDIRDQGDSWRVLSPKDPVRPGPTPGEIVVAFGGTSFNIRKCDGAITDRQSWR